MVDPEYWLISKNNTTLKTVFPNTGNPVVEIFPNPIQNPLTVYLHDFNQPAADLVLYNMLGQLVYKQNIKLFNGAEFLQLNLSNLSRGEYIIKVTAGEFKYTKKLLN